MTVYILTQNHYEDGNHIIGLFTERQKAVDSLLACKGTDDHWDYRLHRYYTDTKAMNPKMIGEVFFDYEHGWKTKLKG